VAFLRQVEAADAQFSDTDLIVKLRNGRRISARWTFIRDYSTPLQTSVTFGNLSAEEKEFIGLVSMKTFRLVACLALLPGGIASPSLTTSENGCCPPQIEQDLTEGTEVRQVSLRFLCSLPCKLAVGATPFVRRGKIITNETVDRLQEEEVD
jgi:hypothetical protein